MKAKSNRLLAVEGLSSLLSDQGSINTLLPAMAADNPTANMPLIQEYLYGTCRWYHRLSFCLDQLMDKPLRKKDQDVRCLLLLGLYQLFFMRTPDHAAINETVALTRQLKKDWASKLVNAVLRSARRRENELMDALNKQPFARFSHPQWLAARLQQDWPDHVEAIMEANNQQAPMTLRLNTRRLSRQDYLEQLESAGIAAVAGTQAETAVILADPLDVTQLPGFTEGLVSVQDEASQLAAALLAPDTGAKVLDACAAPGGKTCALLEAHPGIGALVALDSSENRLSRVHDNLQRLNLQATVVCADAANPASWWDGQLFDCILLDAPCSATGVIRRHPDIKLLRQDNDISKLAALQQQLLTALWPCLKPGGKLLYSTCSLLREENEQQIHAFLEQAIDARACSFDLQLAHPCTTGMQLLPGAGQMDGFYYALLEKY